MDVRKEVVVEVWNAGIPAWAYMGRKREGKKKRARMLFSWSSSGQRFVAFHLLLSCSFGFLLCYVSALSSFFIHFFLFVFACLFGPRTSLSSALFLSCFSTLSLAGIDQNLQLYIICLIMSSRTLSSSYVI